MLVLEAELLDLLYEFPEVLCETTSVAIDLLENLDFEEAMSHFTVDEVSLLIDLVEFCTEIYTDEQIRQQLLHVLFEVHDKNFSPIY